MRKFRVLPVMFTALLLFLNPLTASADEEVPPPGLEIRNVDSREEPQVGDRLRSHAVNNREGATWEDVVWYSDDEPIPGATGSLLTLSGSEAGKRITVSATAVRANGERPRITSEPVGPILPGDIRASFGFDSWAFAGEPLIVQLTPGEPAEVDVSYQWSLDGVLIPDAKGNRLTLTKAMGGKTITAVATVSAHGYRTAVRTAEQEVRDEVYLDGRPGIGFTTMEKVAVEIYDYGYWSSPASTATYQWLLDGVPISGETRRVLGLRSAWNGQSVSVRVTRSTPALKPKSAVSKSLVVNVEVDVYTTPGRHSHNGREWLTECEPYSQTTRCRTDIIASTVKKQDDGSYRVVNDWAFNNLTYLPSSADLWKSNPLGQPGEWTATDGRRWKTECFATTLPHVCRSFAWTHHMAAVPGNPGVYGYDYVPRQGWVFNNQVHLR